jgi:hypothetical protein
MSVKYFRYLPAASADDGPVKTEDWVEYEGCAELEMSELVAILGGSVTGLCKVVKAAHIKRPATGEIITEVTPKTVMQIRPQIFDWLCAQTRDAARDEALDPEA